MLAKTLSSQLILKIGVSSFMALDAILLTFISDKSIVFVSLLASAQNIAPNIYQ